jgi:hypothetical protein
MDFWRKGKRIVPKKGDIIICWGSPLPEIDGVRVLNGEDDHYNKYRAAEFLSFKGIPTITAVAQSRRPTPVDANGMPIEWVPRTFHHVGGNDLIKPPYKPDFWVKKENFVREFRVHSFASKSIRAGVKVHREGFANPSPWIRSFDAGWRINYDNFSSTKQLRSLAHKACKTMNLVFGAVDIAEKADGTMVVLEINRAPGIEGNSIPAYCAAIQKWAKGESEGE